jgi:hypothetical protein
MILELMDPTNQPALDPVAQGFRQEIREKVQSLSLAKAGGRVPRVVQMEEGSRVIVNHKKTRFDINGVSASIRNTFSYSRIPFTKPQIAYIRDVYNSNREQD